MAAPFRQLPQNSSVSIKPPSRPSPLRLFDMFFRRKEMPWEVVHSCSVEPVPVYYEDDDDGLSFFHAPPADLEADFGFRFRFHRVGKRSHRSEDIHFGVEEARERRECATQSSIVCAGKTARRSHTKWLQHTVAGKVCTCCMHCWHGELPWLIPFLSLSWTLTLLRRGDVQRIQVEYSATRKYLNLWVSLDHLLIPKFLYLSSAARSLRTIKRRQPPFMAVLQAAY